MCDNDQKCDTDVSSIKLSLPHELLAVVWPDKACDDSGIDLFYFAKSSLQSIGKQIQQWMIGTANEYSCDEFHYCCKTDSWCTKKEEGKKKRDPFEFWSTVFQNKPTSVYVELLVRIVKPAIAFVSSNESVRNTFELRQETDGD